MSSKRHCFVALYSGRSIGEACILAASADPELVALLADRMLTGIDTRHTSDPLQKLVQDGRRRALQRILKEDAANA